MFSTSGCCWEACRLLDINEIPKYFLVYSESIFFQCLPSSRVPRYYIMKFTFFHFVLHLLFVTTSHDLEKRSIKNKNRNIVTYISGLSLNNSTSKKLKTIHRCPYQIIRVFFFIIFISPSFRQIFFFMSNYFIPHTCIILCFRCNN